MSVTTVPKTSGLNLTKASKALFAMVQRQPNQINALAGPAPKIDKSAGLLRGQSSSDMPIVRVTDLQEEAGDTVRVDMAHTAQLRAIMGDQNAEGKGAKLEHSFDDVSIDMATIPVSAGGKMTRRRVQHDLVANAMNQLKSGIPRFEWQAVLTHLAGGRGQQINTDWVLPLATDPEFADQMVNPVLAPSYNRHYVSINGSLTPGGAELANVDSADISTLDTVDQMQAILAEHPMQMLPIAIPGDPVAYDDPIRAVYMVDDLVWNTMVTAAGSASIREWMAKAVRRAEYGRLRDHPLFAGETFLWNGVLVRKMGRFAIRWNADGTQAPAYIKVGDRYTATQSVDVTIPNLTSGSNKYMLARSLLLGGQALALAFGSSEYGENQYALLDESTNFKRNKEMAGEVVYGAKKLRFKLPDGNGNYEPTDIGVFAIDTVVKKASV